MEQQAFVLRLFLDNKRRLQEALECDQIMIGWAHIEGLLDENLDWEEFRSILSPGEKNLRKAGAACGSMWKFVREMKEGDLVVVPYGPNFYVAEVTGPATYDESKVDDDTSYRRCVQWQNDKKPIPRSHARSALISRMKVQQTCVRASDLLPHIEECLRNAATGKEPSFQVDLRQGLVEKTLREIRSGRMDAHGFERLVRDVLRGLGAREVRIIPRNQDKGADIMAVFGLAEAFSLTLAVQAKHYQATPPVGRGAVEQLVAGMAHEEADMGMVVTSGEISTEAEYAKQQLFEDDGRRIELVDGEQLAGIIVEHGLSVMKGPQEA